MAGDADHLFFEGAPDGASALARAASGEEVRLELSGGAAPASALSSPMSWACEWADAAGRRRAAVVERVPEPPVSPEDVLAEASGDEASRWSAADVERACRVALETAEGHCRRAFGARYGQARLRVGPGGLVELPWCDVREASAASLSGETVACELASDCQVLVGAPVGSLVRVEAVHGLDPVPERVRWALAQIAAHVLRPDARPANATGESTDFGFVRFSIAGRDGATGLVEVDAALAAYARSGRLIA